MVSLGLVEYPQNFENGNHRYPDSARNLKATAEWGRNMPRFLLGEYTGITLAPAIVTNLFQKLLSCTLMV